MRYCQDCKKSYQGTRHDCPAKMSLAERLAQEAEGVKPEKPNKNDSHSPEPVPQPKENVKESKNRATSYDPTGPERVSKWRANNREKYNAYMREYRRKRRSE